MRKLYPLPVNGLFSHPDWVALPTAARGMLMSLCEHFWRTACRPLPKDDDQLFAIARAHRPTWRHHKPMILRVFAEIEPELAAYWRHREAGGTQLRIAQRKGGAVTASLRAAAAVAEASPSRQSAPLPALEPNAVQRPMGRANARRVEAVREAVLTAARMTDRVV